MCQETTKGCSGKQTVALLVRNKVPAANRVSLQSMYTGRNASDWIMVTVVSNEDSHRGSHVCIGLTGQETTDPQSLNMLWTHIPLLTVKKNKVIIRAAETLVKVLLSKVWRWMDEWMDG